MELIPVMQFEGENDQRKLDKVNNLKTLSILDRRGNTIKDMTVAEYYTALSLLTEENKAN